VSKHSYSANTARDRSERSKQNCTVEQDILVFDVMQIVLQILVNWECPSWANLPQTSYTWLGDETFTFKGAIPIHNKRHFGSRTYETHLSSQNIDKLRQLVNAQAANQAANTS
jgi:hypothetical protein